MESSRSTNRVERRSQAFAVNACAAAVAVACFGVAASARAASCESLTALSLNDTTITSAESVPAGTYTLPSGQQLPNLPASCRVTGVIKPTADSNILFEMWLPAAGWNSRLQQVGNGGLAGNLAIFYATVPGALQRGYAVAGTDDGHQASPLDASWAIGHPEKVVDFGYRAVHLTNVNAKAITEAFYTSPPRYTYFNACSEGGREAHMEAQRFAGDFDGMLVGSPAHFWTDLMVRFQWDQHGLLVDPASYIPASKLPAAQAAALAVCDGIDGVADGIVDDPRKCQWNPAALLCTGADNDSCLHGTPSGGAEQGLRRAEESAHRGTDLDWLRTIWRELRELDRLHHRTGAGVRGAAVILSGLLQWNGLRRSGLGLQDLRLRRRCRVRRGKGRRDPQCNES